MKPEKTPATVMAVHLSKQAKIEDEKGFNDKISLRDYFAIEVMSAIIGNTNSENPRGKAKVAYDVADAMLQIRKETLPKV
jgi:hypothetical protein